MSENITEIERLLNEWYAAKKQLDHFKVEEMRLRKEVFDLAFPSPKLGTNKIKLNHDMALVGEFKLNYRIDKPALLSMRSEPNIAPLLDEVIDYRPEVRGGAFEKLPTPDKNLLSGCITSAAGSPSLEIKSAKNMRW